MFILLYLSLLFLLILGAVYFFVRALNSAQLSPVANRRQIIEQLERQFHNSPDRES
jgi:flagellar biogenesis protein FliO